MKYDRIWLVSALAAGGLAISACATEEYVDTSIAAHNAQNEQQFATVNSRMDQLNADTKNALARAEAAHKLAEGDFQHSVLYSDDSVKFATAKSDLSDEAKASLTAFADKLKSDNRNVYIEIQGHADSRGSEKSNKALGQARAEAVREFLAGQGVPLRRMDTISSGETKSTGKSEAEDRRAVLVVMD